MKLLVLALSLVGFASTASAAIFVEPYAGYGLGNYEIAAAAEKGKVNGPVIGGRVGAEMTMLFIGGDYSVSMGAKAKETAAGAVEVDAESTQLYGVIGANLPLLRGWVGYGLMNELTFKDPGGADKFKGGSHIKVGLGIKVIPMVSLNIEYLMDAYKKLESGGATSSRETKVNTVLLSASVPLSF